MLHEQHRNEREEHEYRCIWEECFHSYICKEESAEYRRYDLCAHAGSVVETGVLARIGGLRHLNHHGIAVYVNRCPSYSGESEESIHNPDITAFTHERSCRKRESEDENACQYGLFPAEF